MRKQTIILLGLLICAIALGVAYALRPAYPRAPSERVCRAFRKQMGMAKAQWATEEHKTTNDTATAAALFGPTRYMREEPQCPDGGNYTLGRVGEPVRCSVRYHTD